MTENEVKWVNATTDWCDNIICKWNPRYIHLFNGQKLSELIQSDIPGIGVLVIRVVERIGMPCLEVAIKSGNKYTKLDNKINVVKLLKVRKVIDEFKSYADTYLEHCESALREYLKLNEKSYHAKEQLRQLYFKIPDFGNIIDKIYQDNFADDYIESKCRGPVIRTNEEFGCVEVIFSARIHIDETDMCNIVKRIVSALKCYGIIVQADPCEWFFAHFRSQTKHPTIPANSHDEYAYIHFKIVSF